MRILAICLLLILVGCAPSPKQPESTTALPSKDVSAAWQQHQKKIEALPKWYSKGRLAVTHGQKGGNASFIWQQNDELYQIKLHGPFGSGALMINGAPNQVYAQDANGKKHQAKTPEELMQQIVGWYVPISGLRYWIRGIPIPNVKVASHQLNSNGYLKQLNQDGWSIQYGEYVFDKIALPKTIQLHNPKLKIKLIITAWD